MKVEREFFVAVVVLSCRGLLQPVDEEIEYLLRLGLRHQYQHALRVGFDLAQVNKAFENNVRLSGGERREWRAFRRQEPNEIDPARVAPFGEIFNGWEEDRLNQALRGVAVSPAACRHPLHQNGIFLPLNPQRQNLP